MLNQLTYSLPAELQTAVERAFDEWQKEEKIARVWKKDASVWTNDDEAKWLGWLDSVDVELSKIGDYKAFSEDAKQFDSIVLLGMGGSSLCPEVLSITFGKKQFHILDSTVPAQIKTLESKIDLAKTLFIVASKSGSTLEPNCFKQYFFERVSETVGAENAGKQFVAITDPNSKMQQVAESDNFRIIFFGNPEIGGRFSALSPFGMAAGAAMSIDVEDFLTRASEMVAACKIDDPHENPAAILGTILGVCQTHGRDKLTIFTSDEIYDVGAWLEQLIAESTGKDDIAIIPVDREPVQPAASYGDDRVFVFLTVKDSKSGIETDFEELEKAGHPSIRIELADKMNLGQEFFRWEFATAVAGSLMRINPFNQPDVESAKIEAKKLTEEYETNGKLSDETPFYEEDGIKLFTDKKNVAKLNQSLQGEKSLANYLKAHLSRIETFKVTHGEISGSFSTSGNLTQIETGDYFALLAYIEMNSENEMLLQTIRQNVLSKHKIATCLGIGPRFLHSTGQAYKGGANNGVFLQITSEDAVDLEVPGQKYTFGVVKAAQARGDFQVLIDRERRALRVHLGADVKSGLEKILNLLQS